MGLLDLDPKLMAYMTRAVEASCGLGKDIQELFYPPVDT